MPIAIPSTPKLTGLTRIRVSFFGKLILQVQHEIEWTLPFVTAKPRIQRTWRDARVQDFFDLKIRIANEFPEAP